MPSLSAQWQRQSLASLAVYDSQISQARLACSPVFTSTTSGGFIIVRLLSVATKIFCIFMALEVIFIETAGLGGTFLAYTPYESTEICCLNKFPPSLINERST
jgi:hypothetical protein